MNPNEVRKQFLDFFSSKEHEIVPSSSVVPHEDPTLLFANAGMNQFKDVFLGAGTRPYRRAANTQKCIRAGGKHNDLDDVGQDTYHHTFFEMLGNWSFGDYFKKEAIEWAWELLTGVWGIDPTRLHATYFEGDAEDGLEPDNEARDLWLMLLPPERVHTGNKKDNFWEMGDSGPCGPCSEIHIDLTPDKSGGNLINADDPRVIELWNLVFIQFNRDTTGKLSLLPAKHVDTGMGFERVCAVLAGKGSNYDTDVFMPIFSAIQARTGAPAYTGLMPSTDGGAQADPKLMIDISYRVMADHLRCLTFALTDGATPSNDGRGSVLRRILRRAVRYGRQYLNMTEPFLCDLVSTIAEQMGDAFPELRNSGIYKAQNIERVAAIIRDEEESFGRTLDRGIKHFDTSAQSATEAGSSKISGEDAFRLHGTYGFPIDLTEQMARERGMTVDIEAYNKHMDADRERARGGAQDGADLLALIGPDDLQSLQPTDDALKYKRPATCEAKLVLVRYETEPPAPGGGVVFMTDKTCFYAEQGGQVADTGTLVGPEGEVKVTSVAKRGEYTLHVGDVVGGQIAAGQTCTLSVDPARSTIMANHTATHLLNWALREVLGDHVQQRGSLVDAQKTRFDLSHNKAIEDDEIQRIEALVQEQIAAAAPVCTEVVDQADARGINTLRAVFGETYPDKVRVVSAGAAVDEMMSAPQDDRWMKHAVEFCGGTHVDNTSEIGDFVIVAEESAAKGVRRVVGVTGDIARVAREMGRETLAQADALLESISHAKDSDAGASVADKLAALQQVLHDAMMPVCVQHAVREKITEILKHTKRLEKQSASASAGAVQETVAALLQEAPVVDDVVVVVGEVPQAEADALRSAVDWVRNKTEASAVLLVTAAGDKVTLIAGMSKVVVKKGVKAGDLIKEIAPIVGGRGGGRPDMAQGGGTDPSQIPQAIDRAKAWLAEKL